MRYDYVRSRLRLFEAAIALPSQAPRLVHIAISKRFGLLTFENNGPLGGAELPDDSGAGPEGGGLGGLSPPPSHPEPLGWAA